MVHLRKNKSTFLSPSLIRSFVSSQSCFNLKNGLPLWDGKLWSFCNELLNHKILGMMLGAPTHAYKNFFAKRHFEFDQGKKDYNAFEYNIKFPKLIQTRCITVINFYTLTLVSSLIWSFKWPNFLSCVGIRIDFCACNCKRMMRKIIAIHNIVILNLIIEVQNCMCKNTICIFLFFS